MGGKEVNDGSSHEHRCGENMWLGRSASSRSCLKNDGFVGLGRTMLVWVRNVEGQQQRVRLSSHPSRGGGPAACPRLSQASLLMIQERGTSSSFIKVTNGSGPGSLGNHSGEE